MPVEHHGFEAPWPSWPRWPSCFTLSAALAPERAVAAAVLVSQGKPATASSAEGPFTAPNAVDGNPATRCVPASSPTTSGSASTSARAPRSARSC
ncbi:hypothetical protein SMICM304S_06024 [Streptomyces microflavus]